MFFTDSTNFFLHNIGNVVNIIAPTAAMSRLWEGGASECEGEEIGWFWFGAEPSSSSLPIE